MDKDQFKAAADVTADIKELEKKFKAKRFEVKRKTFADMCSDFKSFFKDDNIKISHQDYSEITAHYKDVQAKLSITPIDLESEFLSFNARLVMPPKGIFNVIVRITTDYPPLVNPTQEQMEERNLEYQRAFVADKIGFTKTYMVDETKKTYNTFAEVLNAI